MSISLHAQPYDLSATGFYFGTAEDFKANSSTIESSHKNLYKEEPVWRDTRSPCPLH